LQDGEIVYYQEFERRSKIKQNRVPDTDPFLFYHSEDIKQHTNFIDYIIFATWQNRFDQQKISSILDQLKNSGLKWNNIVFNANDHHLYHASNAAFSSGFDECACLITDGSGACLEPTDNNPFREIESIYSFDYVNGLQTKFKHYSRLSNGFYKDFEVKNQDDHTLVLSDSISCGMLFNTFSHGLGYKGSGDSGKLMGLASYGEKTDTYGNWYGNISGIEITNNNVVIPLYKMIGDMQLQEQKNILRTLQEETKNHTIHLIKKTLDLCNTNNIVLSGGYFLNCVNNYYYLKEFPEVNFYVDPISHDGGTSIGAAKYLWYNISKDKTIRKLDTLYL
jgi:carbamoyltransferase